MITSVSYNKLKDEASELNKIIRDVAARLTDEQWNLEMLQKQDELRSFLEDKPLMDMLLYDITGTGDLEYLEEVRKEYKLAFVMLLADGSISPMKYMKPSIQAQSLLLRPFSREQALNCLSEFIGGYVKAFHNSSEDNRATFIVESKDEGKISIPYDQIYYFEAMEKKVYVCTGVDEYGFYDTLDGLMENLPEEFLRCHRSFIVNKNKIVRVALSQNTIYLEDEYEVPLSRSYKPDFKEM
ncbi:MAG: LytTR family transcriptional regulator DNA-binding domain-containing protein [Lachnospiraceae bacterium]|nr:LytTR family transcriptional regulator DNA-binding domain-containing protein [Lachnospiraceae bacterium]